MKERLREMDFIRAVAALSIIAIHISAQFVLNSRIAYYINQAVRYAVPLFILISGLLLYNSAEIRHGLKGYLKFMSKRLKKVFIPYLIWTLLYIAYIRRHDLASIWLERNRFLPETFKTILLGGGYLHLYFVIIIIQLYLLFPLLKHLMQKHGNAVLAVCFAITFFFQTAIYLKLMRIITFPDFVIQYYKFFPTWIFYFVFGMYFAEKKETWNARYGSKLFGIAAVWLLSFIILILDSRYSKTFDSSIKPSVMLYCITTFLLFHSVLLKFRDSNSILWKALDWISAQSYLLYLSHLMIMNLIVVGTKRLIPYGLWPQTTGLALLYTATTLLTCLFAYIVSKTTIAGFLGGAAPKRLKQPSANVQSKSV